MPLHAERSRILRATQHVRGLGTSHRHTLAAIKQAFMR